MIQYNKAKQDENTTTFKHNTYFCRNATTVTYNQCWNRLTHIAFRMKVKIRNWNAVATWRWDLPEDDVCGICQVHFDGTCPTCKYPGDDCSLLSGKCGHNFHMHCIMEWIKQDSAKGQCPMCRQKFEWTDVGGRQQQPQPESHMQTEAGVA
ncbi:anaphase-promoting complex subunit 11 RING-H2 finger-domain-containing protein [Poronia punctata]|nr:anaphase-promoting complex subunit 11 RING-H2 finger-domain-containing protein [Poronia punctata]